MSLKVCFRLEFSVFRAGHLQCSCFGVWFFDNMMSMKNTLFALGLLAIVAGCKTIEEPLEQKSVSFTASIASAGDSKADYSAVQNKAVWEYGDVLGCFAEYCNNIRFTNSTEDTDVFTGSIWGEPDEFYMYFPFDAAASFQGTVLTSTYPSEQSLAEGTFSTNPPMASCVTSLASGATFRNACGLIKFSVTTDVERTLVKATFAGADEEPIAGLYTMDLASDTPEMKIADNGAKMITMTGEVKLTSGRRFEFYMPLPPTEFGSGVVIKLTDDAGNMLVKEFSNPLVLRRNGAVEISTPLEFTAANSVPASVLTVNSLTLPSISGASVVIDEEAQTITVTRDGFVDPRNVNLGITYTANVAGQNVSPVISLEPTTTITEASSDDTGTISRPSSFTANLMMPRTLTLQYGEVSKSYTIKFSQLKNTGLPVVYIITSTGMDVPVNDKDTWIEGSEIYIDADGTRSFDNRSFTDLANIECEVKGRGNTTWEWVVSSESLYPNGAKRPYAIKLDKKKEVLGMAKHKRWVLLNSFADKSLIRNYVAYMMANAFASVGTQEWHPSGQPVELVMNGLHRGSYFLCEQIKIDDDSRIKGVEYDDETPEVTGAAISYLLEGDRNWGTDPSETLYWESYRRETQWEQSSNGTNVYGTNYMNGKFSDLSRYYKFRWGMKSPDDGDLETAGMRESEAYKFIKTKVTDVEKYLFGGGFTETTSLAEINTYINLDSFIEYWLVYEVATNQELNNPGSCYMHYYNVDGRLYMGPVWDFDYGSFLTSAQFDDGLYPNKDTHFQNANALWYCRLLQNRNVQDYIVQVWPKYRAKAAEVAENITAIKSYLSASAEINFNMWPMYSNYDPNTERNMTFDAAADRIQTNMRARLSQLDNLINNKLYK